ncbi:hypothetical protein U3A55_00165 [Salarchaeum sp. III]|uniref:hypothetical protein n=1 Tax=Salarchaeum sp. III TaxID=3107927 RepID=UPI002EDBB1F9
MKRDSDPTNEEEFHDELRTLLAAAHERGVDVRGGWDCRFDNGPDFEVVVVEAQKP